MALPETLNPVYVGDPLPAALNEERNAVNTLSGEVQTKIPLPPGAAVGDLLRWDGTQWLTTETRFFEGEGRPDGNFAAPVGSRYIDKIAQQGAVEWVKRSGGDSNDGWMCLAGDTGLRNIASLIAKPTGAVVTTAVVRRIGQVCDMYFDLTMPAAYTSLWTLFAALPGFSPSTARYGGLQDNGEGSNTGGTIIDNDGGVGIYRIVTGVRARYSGTYLTDEPWPNVLPGVAA